MAVGSTDGEEQLRVLDLEGQSEWWGLAGLQRAIFQLTKRRLPAKQPPA